jgi:hypothetical protein
MQPDGPYQLIEALGSCQVGTVWSAVDAKGRSLTIAVLDPAVAADQRWRDAFAATADALLRPEAGGPHFLSADYAASSPWVACVAGEGPGAERVFLDLGMEYRPASSPDPAGGTGPLPAVPSPADPGLSGAAAPNGSSAADTAAPAVGESSYIEWPSVGLYPETSRPMLSPAPSFPISPSPVPAPVDPTSGAGGPVSGVPQSPAAAPQSPAFGPMPPAVEPVPPAGEGPQWPPRPLPAAGELPSLWSQYAPGFPPPPTEPDEPRRRTGLWIAISIVVVLALAAGAGVYAWRQKGGTPTVTRSSSPQPVDVPAGPPVSPGVEPPRPGDWPTWPAFGPADPVQTLELQGVGFPLTVPATWKCANSATADGYAKYQCGDDANKDQEIGGEFIVRECEQPCDDQRRATLRQNEEAWGLQWRDGGPDAVLAETLKLNGGDRYALVVVAFWRSAADAPIDRELIMRMTSPVSWCDTLRRVANAVRDQTHF